MHSRLSIGILDASLYRGVAVRQKDLTLTLGFQAVKELGLKLIPATTSFVDQARTLLALGYGSPAYKK